MSVLGVGGSGCPGPPPRVMAGRRWEHATYIHQYVGQSLVQKNGKNLPKHELLENPTSKPPAQHTFSAKDLTGAPLINYMPKNRKLKKKTSAGCVEQRGGGGGGNGGGGVARLRHSSEQNMASVVQVVPQQYYLGQNLYHKLVQEHNNLVYLQDFYR